MGLDWPTSLELIRRSLDAARDTPGALVASGCGTDHLAPEAAKSVDDVIRAYEEQIAAIEAVGGRIILMASRALVRSTATPMPGVFRATAGAASRSAQPAARTKYQIGSARTPAWGLR